MPRRGASSIEGDGLDEVGLAGEEGDAEAVGDAELRTVSLGESGSGEGREERAIM
jgi:hypothetical protein